MLPLLRLAATASLIPQRKPLIWEQIHLRQFQVVRFRQRVRARANCLAPENRQKRIDSSAVRSVDVRAFGSQPSTTGLRVTAMLPGSLVAVLVPSSHLVMAHRFARIDPDQPAACKKRKT